MDLDPELLKELIGTFTTELEEQLQVITDGLLYLEKNNNPNDAHFKKRVETIFRAAHNIKGASRGIGIENIGDIAHSVESIFTKIKSQSTSLSKTIISLCLEAVDNMRIAMQCYINHDPLPFNLDTFLTRLTSNQGTKAKKPQTKIDDKQREMPAMKTDAEHETIRISVDHLDQVAAMIDEIQVNKIAIEEYYRDLTKINSKFQQLSHLWKKAEYSIKDPKNETLQKMYSSNIDNLMDISNEIRVLHNNMRPRMNELAILSNSLQEEVRLLRLIPASTLLKTFPRLVRDLANKLDKKVELKIKGEEVRVDKMILEGLKDPIIHILRNAIDHGIEESTVRKQLGKPETAIITIHLYEEGNQIYIRITDDGAGIDSKKVAKVAEHNGLVSKPELENMSEDSLLNLIFKPGLSTKDIITDVSGRGVGLDVVKENVENLKGSASIETELGKSTSVIIRVPLTLTSEHGLMVNCSGQTFALLTSSVERVLILPSNEIIDVSASQAIMLDKHPIPLRILSDILGYKKANSADEDKHHIVVIKNDKQIVALLVDEIIGEREMVIKPLQPPLLNVLCTAGGTLSGSGEVIIVLNSIDLINIALQAKNFNRITTKTSTTQTLVKPHILVVDDSITTRTMEKNILESKNYTVTVAVNGKEAWDILQKQKFALLITDVSMPIMDGFTLTERVKTSPELHEMPVIIVTSLDSAEEKKRGIDVGANAYIVKNDFESDTLLEIVSQLV